jgi:hypothetical protein
MSEQVQVQRQKLAPSPLGSVQAVQRPEPEYETRPDIDAQLEGAARFGHSLGAVGVEGGSSPLIQRQVKPEDEEEQGAVQRQGKPEEEEDKDALQMQRDEPQVGPEGGRVPPGVESAIQRARGGGQPLEAGVQAQMGEALGHDFSRVRVHADAGADTLNRQIQAKAFTTGQDVFFRQGTYNPVSSTGLELLRHELSHVKQQSTGRVSGNSNGMTVRPAGDAFEREANARVGQEPKGENHQPQGISGVQRYTIQREISLNEWKWDSFNLIFSRSDELKLIDKAIENYENAVKNKELKRNVDFVSMLEKILFAIENWKREKSKKGKVSKRQNSVEKLKKKVIEEIGKHPISLDEERSQLPQGMAEATAPRPAALPPAPLAVPTPNPIAGARSTLHPAPLRSAPAAPTTNPAADARSKLHQATGVIPKPQVGDNTCGPACVTYVVNLLFPDTSGSKGKKEKGEEEIGVSYRNKLMTSRGVKEKAKGFGVAAINSSSATTLARDLIPILSDNNVNALVVDPTKINNPSTITPPAILKWVWFMRDPATHAIPKDKTGNDVYTVIQAHWMVATNVSPTRIDFYDPAGGKSEAKAVPKGSGWWDVDKYSYLGPAYLGEGIECSRQVGSSAASGTP